MQVGRTGIRVSRRSYVGDDIAAFHAHPFAQPVCVTVQVRIVITILARFIEFINGVAARFAEEQLADRPRNHSVHRRAARGHDIDGFVRVSVANFVEGIVQIREFESLKG